MDDDLSNASSMFCRVALRCERPTSDNFRGTARELVAQDANLGKWVQVSVLGSLTSAALSVAFGFISVFGRS